MGSHQHLKNKTTFSSQEFWKNAQKLQKVKKFKISQGKLICKLKFNQLRIKILLKFFLLKVFLNSLFGSL